MKALVGLSIAALEFFGYRIAELENERYARQMQLCGVSPNVSFIEQARCYEQVEARTSSLWNFYYGLLDK